MRGVILSLGLGLFALLAIVQLPQAARAYDGPWCAIVDIGGGVVQERCSMATFEECRREALRWGTTSFCRQNPAYPGYWSTQAVKPRYKQRLKRRR